MPDRLLDASLEEQDEQHERRKGCHNEGDKPNPEIFPAHAGLIDHPDKDPHNQAEIVDGHPSSYIHREAARVVRCCIEEKDSQREHE